MIKSGFKGQDCIACICFAGDIHSFEAEGKSSKTYPIQGH